MNNLNFLPQIARIRTDLAQIYLCFFLCKSV